MGTCYAGSCFRISQAAPPLLKQPVIVLFLYDTYVVTEWPNANRVLGCCCLFNSMTGTVCSKTLLGHQESMHDMTTTNKTAESL